MGKSPDSFAANGGNERQVISSYLADSLQPGPASFRRLLNRYSRRRAHNISSIAPAPIWPRIRKDSTNAF